MKFRVVAIGKLKDTWLQKGCDEYLKRIKPLAKIEVLELADESGKDSMSEAQINQLLKKEGEKALRALSPSSCVVVLDLGGKRLSSEGLADYIARQSVAGNSLVEFVIGGSYGISCELRQRADLALSFSDLTFPHQLIRLFLLEQLYRSVKINAGHTYHK